MFKLFKRPLEIDTVAAAIAEDFLDTQLRWINGLLDEEGYRYASIEQAEESVAFVYVIAIFGIQASLINDTTKHKFCMAITGLWADKLIRPKWEAVPFLQQRLKEYRAIQDPAKLIVAYLERLGIADPKHVAFFAAMRVSVSSRITGISEFIDDVSKSHKLV